MSKPRGRSGRTGDSRTERGGPWGPVRSADPQGPLPLMENSDQDWPPLSPISSNLFTPPPFPASLSVLKSPSKPDISGEAFVFYFKRPFRISLVLCHQGKLPPSAPTGGRQSPEWALDDPQPRCVLPQSVSPFSKSAVTNSQRSPQGPFTPSGFQRLLLY